MGIRRRLLRAAALAALAGLPVRGLSRDAFAAERERLLREIDAQMRETAAQTGRAALSPAVRAAMQRVPRHRFVPAELQSQAYANRPLPIGAGQTISQPFIVALMTELLAPDPGARVLEVGTGSGYQAAVLAECVRQVYTIEIVPQLAERAAALLRELGYRNVEVRTGDGYLGWPEAAPFDAIMVTAAPDHVPQPLVDQLRPAGRMVIPVGPQMRGQDLLLIEKARDGQTVTRRTLAVRFVPLTRGRN
jgi:protein-L-isoaspartate(D-aspartate) O-methyltransferase